MLRLPVNFKKLLMVGATLSILLPAVPYSLNHVQANHENCINWNNELDTDCDGLSNTWENNDSYTKNGITVPLPGADPNHRDIFIEIDYMGHHIPPAAAIDPVVAKFNAFELVNPNGSNGVRLHYIIDDDVPHRDCIDVFSDIVPDPVMDSFDEYKQNFFGTADERASNPNFYEAKRDVYHYAMFIHTRCGNQQSSGAAEWPGNDFEVSLGYDGWGNEDPQSGHDTGSDVYKGATFMHELGHNLALRHAGSTDVPHCKPNYLSVMNYAFQFPTILTGVEWNMDYSHNVINSLKESALVESAGIGIAQPSNLKTAVGHSTFSHGTLPHTQKATANGSPINYNWYRGDTDTSDTVSSSITNFHFFPCNDNDVANTAVGGKLFGYDDVHYNSLVFWSTEVNFQNGTNNTASGSGMDTGIPAQIVQVGSARPEIMGTDPNLIISNQSLLQTNESSVDILKDPQLPPCDISVPGCQDSPCDEQDPKCVPKKEHNFTNPDAALIDVGNRTEVRELTLDDVMKVINPKVIDINGYIQSLNQTQFTNGTDVAKLKVDLQNSLVNGTDSVYNLINASKSEQAIGKLFKLRSLVDGRPPNEILLYPWNVHVLEQVDDLRSAIQQKK
jgi:hypothetical protein